MNYKHFISYTLIASMMISLFSFVQGSFEQSYDTMIETLLSETMSNLSSRDALESKGDFMVSVRTEGEESFNITANIGYHQINQQKTIGLYSEGTLDIDTTLQLPVGYFEIQHPISLQGQIEYKITPSTVYIKINTITIDTSVIPSLYRSDVQDIIDTMITPLSHQWMSYALPTEMRTEMRKANTISPQHIISTLKSYPIIRQIGQKGEDYTITLHTDNIITLLEKYDLIITEEDMISRLDQQSYEEYLKEQLEWQEVISEQAFTNLTYNKFVQLFKDNNRGINLTQSEYDLLITTFESQPSDFIDQVFLTLPIEEQEYIQSFDINEYAEYLKEKYPELIAQSNIYTLEMINYYDTLLSISSIIPSRAEFRSMTYGDFLSQVYSISTQAEFEESQQEWNAYIKKEYDPEIIKKNIQSMMNDLNIQGHMTKDEGAALLLQTDHDDVKGGITISPNHLQVSGTMIDNNTSTSFDLSVQTANTTQYNMNLSMIQNNERYSPTSFFMNLSGTETITIYNNYRLIRPQDSIPMIDILNQLNY